MTEDELISSHARNLKNKAAMDGVITATDFLDERQLSLLAAHANENSEYVGEHEFPDFAGASHRSMVYVPKFYELDDVAGFFSENPQLCPFSMMRVDKDRFSSLSHRDYLGAIMALGVKRSAVGDIIVDSDGCSFLCLKSLERFFCEQLVRVGRGSVRTSVAPLCLDAFGKAAFEHLSFTVSSMRLDCVVSAVFGLARGAAVQSIKGGLVFVNGAMVQKPDSRLMSGSKLVLRSRGKAEVFKDDRVTKKGRLCISVKKYI